MPAIQLSPRSHASAGKPGPVQQGLIYFRWEFGCAPSAKTVPVRCLNPTPPRPSWRQSSPRGTQQQQQQQSRAGDKKAQAKEWNTGAAGGSRRQRGAKSVTSFPGSDRDRTSAVRKAPRHRPGQRGPRRSSSCSLPIVLFAPRPKSWPGEKLLLLLRATKPDASYQTHVAHEAQPGVTT